MERRKFLIGAGSLAAGSAAAVGTGAFTSVSADRGLTVSVEDDADALLGIDDIDSSLNSAYVDTSGDAASIDISTAYGDGVNNNATTKIKDLLIITNQGTQNVYVWAEGLQGNTDFKLGTQISPDTNIQNAGTGAGNNQVGAQGDGGAFSDNSNINPNDPDDDDNIQGTGGYEAAPLLAPGDSVVIEAFIYGDNLSGFNGDVTIKAVAEDEA